jgi:hypothetical protein
MFHTAHTHQISLRTALRIEVPFAAVIWIYRLEPKAAGTFRAYRPQFGNPAEMEFEEMGVRIALRSAAFPLTGCGLASVNCGHDFRVARHTPKKFCAV